ncbi:MAG: hypothetical protein JW786_12875 [Desulfobacterales bacterium]|nr:hypothetical protein [Desulfobacterales bacterium]
MNNETFLQDSQEALNQILRPYQSEINRKQRMADFVKQCIRYVERDDFLALDEQLKGRMTETVLEDSDLNACKDIFDRLRVYTNEKVERYRIQFIEDLTQIAEENNLPISIDIPRFSVLKGIDGEIDFGKRITKINKKVLKSIDPRKIITAVLKIKRLLYDRPYDAQVFIDSIYQTYANIINQENLKSGHPIAIQRFYLEFVISLQSKTFFQDMDKAKFKGYSLDQFTVDFWRYFQAGIGGTSDGYILKLSPGRNKSLWLIDSDGERRQITGISFQEGGQ